MSTSYRNRAIVVMVIIQFVCSFAFLASSGPFTYSPNSSINKQQVIVLPVYSNETTPLTSIGTIMNRMKIVAFYYDECSYSQVSLQSTVHGWTKLDSPMDSYASPWTIGGVDHGGVTDEIFLEAISKVDSVIDFSQYDRLIVVHAGESGQDSDGNYSKIGTCHTEGWFATGDGRIFLDASIVSEFDEVGTIAHELGHDFGAPDLYDYYSETAFWTGIGRWGLMSSGGHNGNPSGTMPSHMCVYNKHLIGWITDKEILTIQNESLTVNLVPLSIQTEGYRAVRYNLGDGTYYLIESRTKVGFDSGLPDSGVLVTLVNETRINDRRDGVQLQLPIYTDWPSQAMLRENEVFTSSESGFSVKVTNLDDELVTIEVSTNPTEDWVISKRISFSEGVEVNQIYVTSSSSDLYIDESVFAAIFTTSDYSQTVQVYRSRNNGRDWSLLFCTNETGYHIYSYSFSVCYFKGSVMLTGRFSNDSVSFLGNIAYPINSGTFSVVNFTSMVNHTLRDSTASAGFDSFYVSCSSRLNDTNGITYFRLRDNKWNSTFTPVPNLIGLKISNPPSGEQDPFVIYRDGTANLRVVRFNESEIIYKVTAKYDGVWDYDIACSSNLIAISYLDGIQNETYIHDEYHVDLGTELGGFSAAIEVSVDSYLNSISMSYHNLTDTFYALVFHLDNYTQFEISNNEIQNKTLDLDRNSYYSRPTIDYSNYPLLLSRTSSGYMTQSLSSIIWIGTPQESEHAIAYYTLPVQGLIIPVYTFPATMLVIIVVLYFVILKIDSIRKIHRCDRILTKIARSREKLTSFTSERISILKPYTVSPLLLVFNILLSISIFHLLMQLPFVGSLFSSILHDYMKLDVLGPLPLLLSIYVTSSFLVLPFDLNKPYSHLQWVNLAVAIIGSSILSNGVTICILSFLLTLVIVVPLWYATKLELTLAKGVDYWLE